MFARIVGSFSVLAAVAIAAWQSWPTITHPKGPTDADISALAGDAHVIVGDVSLVLPYIAMPDQVSPGMFFTLEHRGAVAQWQKSRDEFRSAASSVSTAPALETIKVHIETYGWGDIHPQRFLKLCDQLTREWSRSVCENPWAPLQQALPRDRFYLADDRHFEAFAGHGTVGGESRGDQLRAMSLRSGHASVECDREVSSGRRFCTAAVPITGHLVAVWTVWNGGDESAEAMAEREGRVIMAFVQFSLGFDEDFAALLNEVCAARRPGSDSGAGIKSIPADPCTN